MIKIYGKSNCPNCDMAKALCNSRGIKYQYFDITTNEELLEMFILRGFQSVPQIYYETDFTGTHIGGYAELVDFINNEGGINAE